MIKDLFMESWLLFPACRHACHSVRFIQCYVELLNKAKMLLKILPLT